MTITIDLQPDVERDLVARAAARGLSLIDYVQDMVAREAGASASVEAPAEAVPARDMVELFAPLRGLHIDFERDRDSGRDIVL
jgi:hypothetical protein